MTLSFTATNKIRVNLICKKSIKTIATIKAHKDGSIFINCANKFLKCNEYRSGVMTIPAGLNTLKEFELVEKSGFVISKNNEPKISIHPDGYIQTSFSSKEEISNTRRLKLNFPIGESEGKSIAVLEWSNLKNFEESSEGKCHNLNIAINKWPSYYVSHLKASYNIKSVINGKFMCPDGQLDLSKIDDTELDKLKKGYFATLTMPIKNKTKLIINKDNKNIEYDYQISFLFGIKYNGKIIWYLLSFPPIEGGGDSKINPSFIFKAGFKNFEASKIRETGEQVVLLGEKMLNKKNEK